MNLCRSSLCIGRFIFLLLMLVSISVMNLAYAKRSQAAKVEPVVHEGVRYVAPSMDGRQAVVEAWDVAGGQKLWSVTVFKVSIQPLLEEDVQWVFISAMRVEGGSLVVSAEDGQVYHVDLKSRAVKKADQK
jgi:hypothetical protein